MKEKLKKNGLESIELLSNAFCRFCDKLEDEYTSEEFENMMDEMCRMNQYLFDVSSVVKEAMGMFTEGI